MSELLYGTKAGRTAFCVTRRAEGLPHLGMGLSVLPALQSLPPHTPLGDFTPPAAHFLHVYTDLPTSPGYTYCLTAVDRFTRWPEVVPIPDITDDTVARALTGYISRFVCSQTTTTEQGHQFKSQLFHSQAKLRGIQLSRRTTQQLMVSWNASSGR
jgi:hypothetical protein